MTLEPKLSSVHLGCDSRAKLSSLVLVSAECSFDCELRRTLQVKLLVYSDGTDLNVNQLFVQPEDLTQGSTACVFEEKKRKRNQHCLLSFFFFHTSNKHYYHQFVTKSNWFLSDLRMEEKKKSSRSRLRLFPSFSVKTGVFNKQVRA